MSFKYIWNEGECEFTYVLDNFQDSYIICNVICSMEYTVKAEHIEIIIQDCVEELKKHYDMTMWLSDRNYIAKGHLESEIYEKVKKQKINIADIIGFILAIALLVALPLIPKNEAAAQYNIGVYIIMFVLGIVCSSAMVIPGVSGSLVLMAFGYYAFFMSTMKDFLVNIFNFSSSNYWGMFITLVCFALGCAIGLVFISKLITKLTEKYPKTVYYTILGLLVASPFSIIYATLTDPEYVVTFGFWTILFSIISLFIGVGIVYIGEYFNKKYNKTTQNDSDNVK